MFTGNFGDSCLKLSSYFCAHANLFLVVFSREDSVQYVRATCTCVNFTTSGKWGGGGFEISDIPGRGEGVWFVNVRMSENF